MDWHTSPLDISSFAYCHVAAVFEMALVKMHLFVTICQLETWLNLRCRTHRTGPHNPGGW
jgi:hypothetical protein